VTTTSPGPNIASRPDPPRKGFCERVGEGVAERVAERVGEGVGAEAAEGRQHPQHAVAEVVETRAGERLAQDRDGDDARCALHPGAQVGAEGRQLDRVDGLADPREQRGIEIQIQIVGGQATHVGAHAERLLERGDPFVDVVEDRAQRDHRGAGRHGTGGQPQRSFGGPRVGEDAPEGRVRGGGGPGVHLLEAEALGVPADPAREDPERLDRRQGTLDGGRRVRGQRPGEGRGDAGEGAEVDAEAEAAGRQVRQSRPQGRAGEGRFTRGERAADDAAGQVRFGRYEEHVVDPTDDQRQVRTVEQNVEGDAVLFEAHVAEAVDDGVLQGAGADGVARAGEGHDAGHGGERRDRDGEEAFAEQVAGLEPRQVEDAGSAGGLELGEEVVELAHPRTVGATEQGGQATQRGQGLVPAELGERGCQPGRHAGVRSDLEDDHGRVRRQGVERLGRRPGDQREHECEEDGADGHG
jgi:hypothetical protein